MQISMKAAAGVLVPLALAGTCLACAPTAAWADAAAKPAVAAAEQAAEAAGTDEAAATDEGPHGCLGRRRCGACGCGR